LKKAKFLVGKKLKKLYDKSEKIYFNAKSEEITEEIEIRRVVFFGNIHGGAYEFMKALQSGKNPPFSDEDLDFIQEINKKAPQMLNLLESKVPKNKNEKFFSEKKGGNKRIR